MSVETLPAGLRLGPVHLSVADLGRSVAWWGDVAGLQTREHGASVAQEDDALVVRDPWDIELLLTASARA